MNLKLKKFNQFVLEFLDENKNDPVKAWMSQSNQSRVRSLVSTQVKKDPNAPKRGKSAYLFFCEKYRAQVKKKMGDGEAITNVTRELGSMWNDLKNNPKKSSEMRKFDKLALQDKIRYETEKKNYVVPVEYQTVRQMKKAGPKRGKSAYIFFCEDQRAQVKKDLGGDVKATEVTKELGIRWTMAKKADKVAKYHKLSAKDNERYMQEKKSAEAVPPPTRVSKTKTSEKVKKGVKKLSDYQIFCKENRDRVKSENPKAKASEVTKKLAAEWKSRS